MRCARQRGIRPVLIGADAGGGDLPQLVRNAGSPALRRMAVLLDLGRQGRAAEALAAGLEKAGHDVGGGGGEPVPFHRRVAARKAVVQQLAVLDEQQGIDDQPGNRIEAVKHPFRMAGQVEHFTVAVGQRQAGARLLAEDGEAAMVDERRQLRRQLRLPGNHEALVFQRADEARHPRIADALVVGAPLRELAPGDWAPAGPRRRIRWRFSRTAGIAAARPAARWRRPRRQHQRSCHQQDDDDPIPRQPATAPVFAHVTLTVERSATIIDLVKRDTKSSSPKSNSAE